MKQSKIKKMSYDQLVTEREKLRKEHFELRMQNVLGHLDNKLALRTVKRDIARLNTLIHQNDIGIAGK